ncbi:MAG TPA: amidohydrolase family protein [Candidatus Acidoferrales bacterium]
MILRLMNRVSSSRSARKYALPILLAGALAIAASRPMPARGEGGEPRYFAITHARVVPVSGAVIEDGTVVVAKGLIQAVGASATIPPEAWVIDGKGLTVYPGLIDAGTTVGIGEDADPTKGKPAPPVLGPEGRPGTSPWRLAADEIKTDDKRIETWRNAGFTTTLTVPEGGILPGQAAVLDLAGNRAGDYVVRVNATVPVSFKPVGGFFGFPDSLMGTIAYVRQVHDDTVWYSQAEPAYEANPTKSERPAYDRTEVTLSEAGKRNEIVMLPANNSQQILRALRLADEWKIRAVLYGGQQGYDVADALAAKKMPVLVNLKWPERGKDADPDADQTLRELRFRDRAPGTPAALAKAGVKFGFYSDGLSSPKDIMKSVKRATDAGLTPEAALRAFTLDSADILGLSDRLGSIAPGKIANLVITDGDIFNEKTKVKHVFVDGRWFQIHEEETPPDKSKDKPEDKKPSNDDQSSSGRHAEAEGVGR